MHKIDANRWRRSTKPLLSPGRPTDLYQMQLMYEHLNRTIVTRSSRLLYLTSLEGLLLEEKMHTSLFSLSQGCCVCSSWKQALREARVRPSNGLDVRLISSPAATSRRPWFVLSQTLAQDAPDVMEDKDKANCKSMILRRFTFFWRYGS